MASPIQVAEGCGPLWSVPMISELTRIRYQVTVAADTELQAVGYALKEFPYLTIDNDPPEFGDRVLVDASQHGKVSAKFENQD